MKSEMIHTRRGLGQRIGALDLTALFNLGVSIVVLLFLLVFQAELTKLALPTLSIIASACVLLILTVVIRFSPGGAWSAASVYLVVLSLFHFGLVLLVGLGLLSNVLSSGVVGQLTEWIYRYSTKVAIWLALIGLLSCVIGVQLSYLLSRRAVPRDSNGQPIAGDEYLSHYLSITGCLLVIVSVVTWFVTVFSAGGTELFTSSYDQYLNATYAYAGTITFVWFGMGIGLCFSSTASEYSDWRRVSYLVFLIFALFALPLGLRGEVLFPALAAAVIVVGRRKQLPSLRATLLVGVALLFTISLIHGVRQVGLGKYSTSEGVGNPVYALAEMGASLRPVTEVVLWHERGEGFIMGASYWAPFDRALYYVVPGATRLPAESDERILSALVKQRVGSIGFSPIAEAYRNFGKVGVIVAMFMIGLILGRISLWPVSASYQAALGIILTELLINVRNNFVPVPSHLVMGFVILGTIILIARSIQAEQSVPFRAAREYSALPALRRKGASISRR